MQDSPFRKTGPPIANIRNIPLPEFQLVTLDNGIPVYFINDGSQKLIKLDVVFEGGRMSETQKTQSRVFGAQLKEGTSTMNSEAQSQLFDYYGATYSASSSLDFVTVSLFTLTKHFEKLISPFHDVLFDPVFPQKELDKFKANSIQRLKNDQSKNDIVSYRNLTSNLFGKEHVYGYNSSEETYNALNRESMLSYYQDVLHKQPCKMFLSGSYDEDVMELINKHFGQWSYKGDAALKYTPGVSIGGSHLYESPNKLQVAIRMGRMFGNRVHPDFAKLSFLSNVFGGFFGSRLMKNIREEKGYTYNIYSDIDTLLYDGYFYIATEMAGEHVENALEEIHKEMDILRNELISPEELDMNKNYILGNILNSVDGPFQAIRLIKSTVLNNQSTDNLQDMIDTFANITAEEVRETARKYLDPADFSRVLVG